MRVGTHANHEAISTSLCDVSIFSHLKHGPDLGEAPPQLICIQGLFDSESHHHNARDDHRCQYCSDAFPTSELTFDHVVPVAQGGRKDWENIVTCCVSCNRRKGGRTPAEAGMHLLRSPRRPESAPAVRITIGLRNAPESWRDYLYWNAELDDT